MGNYYIYFLVNLNLILIAARLWGRIDLSWMWIMSPLIAMTLIGLLVVMNNAISKKRLRTDAGKDLNWIIDFVKKAKEVQEKERTIN